MIISLSITALCFLIIKSASVSYSVIVGDDFGHAVTLGFDHDSIGRFILDCIRFDIDKYLTWQGTYSSMFFQALLSPVNGYGMSQLRIIMVLNSLLFFASLFFAVFCFTLPISGRISQLSLAMCICSVFYCILLSHNSYQDVFYWFSGAVSYTLPLIFFLFGLGFFTLYNQKSNTVWFILSLLLGVLGAGGSLTVCGLGCYLGLLFVCYQTVCEKRINKGNIVIITVWILAAGVNAAAPGNYVRQASTDSSGLHLFGAFSLSIRQYVLNLLDMTTDPNTIVFICVFLIILLTTFRNQIPNFTGKYLLLSSVVLLTPFITAFPVELAYGGIGYYPNRCVFVLDFSIIICLLDISLLICSLIRHCLNFNIQMRATTCSLITISIFAFAASIFLHKNIMVDTFRQLYNETYQNYYASYLSFTEEVSEKKGQDILISINDFPEPIPNYYYLELSDNPEYHANKAFAQASGINSIALIERSVMNLQ